MLVIKTKKTFFSQRIILLIVTLLFAAAFYVLSLVVAPAIPGIAYRPINISKLASPKIDDNRIIIPKIGVDIAYGTNGIASLDSGALWRYPERGNPETGGNFIIAAHRFTIQPTPLGTIEKSPFYNIGELSIGDHVFIDFKGKRFAYEVDKIFSVKPNQAEIEAPSATPKLTLYSCTLEGSADGRIVLTAKPLGQVATNG